MNLFVCAACAQTLSHVWCFVTLWTIACQDLLAMSWFRRQEYWSGFYSLLQGSSWPGDLNSEVLCMGQSLGYIVKKKKKMDARCWNAQVWEPWCLFCWPKCHFLLFSDPWATLSSIPRPRKVVFDFLANLTVPLARTWALISWNLGKEVKDFSAVVLPWESQHPIVFFFFF